MILPLFVFNTVIDIKHISYSHSFRVVKNQITDSFLYIIIRKRNRQPSYSFLILMNGAGYPYNLDFDYGALSQLQHFSINNLGDPFIESNYGVHSRQFEVGVLDWFARLWEIEQNEYWGYITNCGTEGNLHGILVGLVYYSFSMGTFVYYYLRFL